MTRVYAVIIHYGNPELTHHVIDCLSRQTVRQNTRVIVVDNGSSVPFAAKLPETGDWLRIARLSPGVGFGKACETGVAIARKDAACSAYLILNNDLSFAKDLVAQFMTSMDEHPQAGLIGPRVVFPDGRFQLSWGEDLHFLSEYSERKRQIEMLRGVGPRYQARERESEQPRRVDWASGAAFLLTRPAHDSIGSLDSGYFFYFEDCDWCRRIRERSGEIWYDPRPQVIHQLGASRPPRDRSERALRFHRSRELGHLRYYARFNSWLQYQGLRFLIGLKAAIQRDWPLLRETLRRNRRQARSLPAEFGSTGDSRGSSVRTDRR